MKKSKIILFLLALIALPAASWAVSYSGTLPVLFINSDGAVTSKETYVTGTYYIDALGLEGYNSLGSAQAPLALQIKGRGNYTWTGFEKKPYRLKFDKKAQPLGMKSNKHFTLLAHADDDLAFLRNTVGFELSRRLGLAYTPEQQPVEVVLNGDYLGLYMLTEHIRVDANRVNITEQQDQETDADKVTGGWLVEIDNYDDEYQVRMNESNGALLRFTLHSPEILSDVQNSYISQLLKDTDAAIYASDKSDTRWEQFINIDSLVAFYIVQEIMDNAESFHGSCYIHKDRGADKQLIFGPVWDFGNSFHRGFDKFIYQDPPFGQNWIGEIARFPRFQAAVKSRWQLFLRDSYATLDTFIDRFVTQITAAAACDGQRWPAYSQGTISKRKEKFKSRLTQKVDFLRQQWGNAATFISAVQTESGGAAVWYTIDGRRLSAAPCHKGLYITNGRKLFVNK